MSRPLVNTTLIGEKGTKEYRFLVDTGATHVGLPSNEIEILGLKRIPCGRIRIITATGVVEQETYTALGRIQGKGFSATVTQAPVPIIEYELLEGRRLKVNPVTGKVEEVPDEELAPPYLL